MACAPAPMGSGFSRVGLTLLLLRIGTCASLQGRMFDRARLDKLVPVNCRFQYRDVHAN
jgi:hypothetical protein